jgi:hypothetical protein
MKWFEIITTEENKETRYCIQGHDEGDAMDWVIEETKSKEFYLTVSELGTQEEIEASMHKSDVIFWGD